MKTTGPILALALCLVLVLGTAACEGNTTTSDVGSTTTLAPGATSTSAQATTSTQATTTTAPVGLPNGASDAAGDMLSFEPQAAPSPFAPVGDIIAVGLEVQSGSLVAHIQTAGDVPAAPPEGVGALIFSVEIWTDEMAGDASYVVGLMLSADLSKRWVASVTELVSGVTNILTTGLTIDGDTLTCSVPLAQLPGLPSSFKWRVSAERGEGDNSFTDYAPEVGADPLNPGLIQFPSS